MDFEKTLVQFISLTTSQLSSSLQEITQQTIEISQTSCTNVLLIDMHHCSTLDRLLAQYPRFPPCNDRVTRQVNITIHLVKLYLTIQNQRSYNDQPQPNKHTLHQPCLIIFLTLAASAKYPSLNIFLHLSRLIIFFN